MGVDGHLFVLYDYENGRICQFSLHRSRTSCPFRTVCPEQECREVRVACGDLKRPLAF